jgi:hypothetical protein
LNNLSDSEDINRAWDNINENIKTSARESLGLHELKQHKQWFDEEFLGFLDQRKQAKVQWLGDPSQINVANLNNVRREARRHFRNKMKECLQSKIDELATNGKLKNIRNWYRGISDYKKGYQCVTNLAKDGKSDFVTDCNSILCRWRSHISQLFDVHGVSYFRQR